MELIDRQELGDVGALVLVLERGDLGQLAMLLGQLGGRRDLDLLGVPERALGERGEPPERFDLVAEQVNPDGAILGGGEHVEQAAPNRELPAILHLVDPLVAGGHQVMGRLVQVEQLAGPETEGVRSERRIGDLLGQRHRADHHDRRGVTGFLEQRVEGGDPQADQVRRRGQMRLVGDAAARVVADGPRLEPASEPGGQVPGGAVVAGDDDRGRRRIAVEQRGQQVWPQRLGHERAPATVRERGGLRVVVGMGEERAEHYV